MSAVDVLALIDTVAFNAALIGGALEVVSALWDLDALSSLALISGFAVNIIAFVDALSVVTDLVVSAV